MGSCRLHHAAAVAIGGHARRTAPAECCGVLVGCRPDIIDALPVLNRSTDPNRFDLDPQGHFNAHREARRRGLTVIGFYHSHPHSPAVPSARDLAEAAYPDYWHLIVSLVATPPEMGVFVLAPEGFTELAVVLVPAGVVD